MWRMKTLLYLYELMSMDDECFHNTYLYKYSGASCTIGNGYQTRLQLPFRCFSRFAVDHFCELSFLSLTLRYILLEVKHKPRCIHDP